MIISKLKEAIICLKAGRVTLPYPLGAGSPTKNLRGLISIDAEKCIGCGGCANVCPSRVIEVYDVSQEIRRLEFNLGRCTYCVRCSEVCPENAITITEQFETATPESQDLHMSVDIFMGSCQRCGRCFTTESKLDELMITGFRDKPEYRVGEAKAQVSEAWKRVDNAI